MCEEFAGHLAFLEDMARERSLDAEETYTMSTDEFGESEDLGRATARAKGRFRTYLKKQARRAAVALAVAVCLALVIKWQVAEAYRVASDSMAPALPAGALVMVDKVSAVEAGDLVVFRGEDGRNHIARADTVGAETATVSKDNIAAERAGDWPRTLDRERLVGRIWLVSR